MLRYIYVMKYIYILSALIASATAASGQKFELSVNAGAAYNRIDASTLGGYSGTAEAAISPTLDFRIRKYQKGNFQVGGYLNVQPIYNTSVFPSSSATGGSYITETRKHYLGAPALTLGVSIGQSFSRKNSEFLTGLRIGGSYAVAAKNDYGSSFGGNLGLYFGYSKFYGPVGLGLNIIPQAYYFDTEQLVISLPVTVGFHFRI